MFPFLPVLIYMEATSHNLCLNLQTGLMRDLFSCFCFYSGNIRMEQNVPFLILSVIFFQGFVWISSELFDIIL